MIVAGGLELWDCTAQEQQGVGVRHAFLTAVAEGLLVGMLSIWAACVSKGLYSRGWEGLCGRGLCVAGTFMACGLCSMQPLWCQVSRNTLFTRQLT